MIREIIEAVKKPAVSDEKVAEYNATMKDKFQDMIDVVDRKTKAKMDIGKTGINIEIPSTVGNNDPVQMYVSFNNKKGLKKPFSVSVSIGHESVLKKSGDIEDIRKMFDQAWKKVGKYQDGGQRR